MNTAARLIGCDIQSPCDLIQWTNNSRYDAYRLTRLKLLGITEEEEEGLDLKEYLDIYFVHDEVLENLCRNEEEINIGEFATNWGLIHENLAPDHVRN